MDELGLIGGGLELAEVDVLVGLVPEDGVVVVKLDDGMEVTVEMWLP